MQSDPIGLRGGLNTYGYVAGNPFTGIDPTGLVRWEATYEGGGIFIGFGAGVHHFYLVSDCVNGKQAEASVYLVGGGMGGSIGYTVIPVSIERRLVFKDHRSTPDPDVFNGQGGMVAAGLDLMVNIFGVREITLGHAQYVSGSGDGVSGGIEIGGYVMTGSSTVWSAKVRDCKCE